MKNICQAQVGVHFAQAGQLMFPDTIHTEVHETQHRCCIRHGELMKCGTASAEAFSTLERKAARVGPRPVKGRHPSGNQNAIPGIKRVELLRASCNQKVAILASTFDSLKMRHSTKTHNRCFSTVGMPC